MQAFCLVLNIPKGFHLPRRSAATWVGLQALGLAGSRKSSRVRGAEGGGAEARGGVSTRSRPRVQNPHHSPGNPGSTLEGPRHGKQARLRAGQATLRRIQDGWPSLERWILGLPVFSPAAAPPRTGAQRPPVEGLGNWDCLDSCSCTPRRPGLRMPEGRGKKVQGSPGAAAEEDRGPGGPLCGSKKTDGGPTKAAALGQT